MNKPGVPVGQLPQPRLLAGDALVPDEPTGVRLVGSAQAPKIGKVKKRSSLLLFNFLTGSRTQGMGESCLLGEGWGNPCGSGQNYGIESRLWL